MVENEISRILKMRAKREIVDREIRRGDIMIANLQKLDATGVPIIGEKIDNHMVSIDGQDSPSPEFDEQVIGMKKGDTKTVRFTYDESINNPDLVGQTEAYEVEVLNVVENSIPEFNDEFLISIGFKEGIDEFKRLTKTRIQRQFDSLMKRSFHNDLIEAYIHQSPFEVPNSMVERIIRSEIDRMRRAQSGSHIDEIEVRNNMRPDAVRAVQKFIIVNAVKSAQGIDVTKEDTDARIESMAASAEMDAKEYRRLLIKEGRMDDLKLEIAEDKAFDWMISVADVHEVAQSGKDIEKPSNIIMP